MEYGKTIITFLFSNEIKNKKILLIDFSKNPNLNILFGVKKHQNIIKTSEENNINLKNQKNVIKINKKINLIYVLDIINENEINLALINYKEKYDLIIIDINSSINEEIIYKALKISDKIIFLTGANLLEIKKTQEILKKYIYEWKIKKKKIKIIFNKYNNKSIDKKILNKMFCEFNIIGKINYRNNFDLLINNNNFINKKIKKEINKIINKIFCKKIKLLKIKKEIFKKKKYKKEEY